MSFILDALKKSEADRQEQASAEFAAIPSAVDEPAAPRWIWILGGLLLVNVAVLGVFMLRGNVAPESVAVERQPTISDEPSFTERLDVASAARPARQATAPPADDGDSGIAPGTATAPPAPLPVSQPGAAVPARSNVQQPVLESSALALPTLTEIRLNDGVDLPDLNLDIHVYGATSSERFVFINMQKHQEGSVLDSGPRLEAITPDGVILDYRGTRFVLPRE